MVLFPAMLRAPLVAEQARSRGIDPHERRRRAFDAVRELFQRLARRHRLVRPSMTCNRVTTTAFELLADLLPHRCPAMLLIATVRNVPDAPGARAGVLASLPGDVRVLALERLARDDARELAARLLRRMAPGMADAGAIADEAAGHPLFIDELVRHAALTNSGEHPTPRFGSTTRSRPAFNRLDASARRVLETACVLGAPTAQEMVAQAASLDMGEFVRVVALLRTSNLVRTRGARVTDAMEPYSRSCSRGAHRRMAPDAKRDCHERIRIRRSRFQRPSTQRCSRRTGRGLGSRSGRPEYAVVAAEQAAGRSRSTARCD